MCSTAVQGYLILNGTKMPETMGQRVSVKACFSRYSNPCRAWIPDITIMNCGSFYIYHLKPIDGCFYAYCTND